uniref:Uncharacterized protein n=1 Tax=uncultured bacterium 34R1 TaxID=581113 RepID=C0K029_9BACT|nr:unknown [uncultured bacterium 34R1]
MLTGLHLAHGNVVTQQTESHLEGGCHLARLRTSVVVEQALHIERAHRHQLGVARLERNRHIHLALMEHLALQRGVAQQQSHMRDAVTRVVGQEKRFLAVAGTLAETAHGDGVRVNARDRINGSGVGIDLLNHRLGVG